MIPYERVEKALQYLAETDVREAEYKAEVESAKRAMDETFKTIAAASDGRANQCCKGMITGSNSDRTTIE